MLLLASVLLMGLLLGWGFGGRIRNLGTLDVRVWWLVPAALLMQSVEIPRAPTGVGRFLPFGVLLLSFALIALVMVANWGIRGFPLILFGVVLNLIPIVLNQGMPVSGPAVVASGGSLEDVPRELGAKHHLQRPQDVATVLADVIPVRPPFRAVVSIGDLVMWVGAAWFLIAAMLGAPRREDRLRFARPQHLRSTRTSGNPR